MPDLNLRPSPGRDSGAARRAAASSWTTLGVISAGGVVGALARYGIAAAFGHAPGTFGWAIWSVNVLGCLLIGVLMVAITEVWEAHRLVRPFLGVGVLGGFTTFSTSILETQQAVQAGAPGIALIYLVATLAGALAAVYTGVRLARLPLRLMAHRRAGHERGERS